MPSGIGIETQHHLTRIPLENTRVISRKRRALRCHHMAQPGHVAGDRVKLAFANEYAFCAQNFPARLVHAVKHLAFLKENCLRRIHIFCRLDVCLQYPTAKADHPTQLVVDGKHQAIAKATVEMTLLAGHQPGLFHQLSVMLLCLGPAHRVFPAGRGKSHAEILHRRLGDASPLQIVPGRLAYGIIQQYGMPSLRQLLVNFIQRVFEAARFFRFRILLKLQHDAGPLGQSFHGLHEINVLIFLNELEHVTPGVATEAVINLPLRIDIEARSFLLVKRTQRHVIAAGALQGKVIADHIDNVAGRANLLDRGLRNAPGHSATVDYSPTATRG